MELSIRAEKNLNKTIVSLHPHKQQLKNCRVNSFIIRKGWGAFKRILEAADGK